jgi:hypothetical protein
MMDFTKILDRVTVRDILWAEGYTPGKSRTACPIHGGKNRTSFAFTDHTYICHSCGSKGGLCDLVQALRHCDRECALKQLSHLAFITPSETSGNRHTQTRPTVPFTQRSPRASPRKDPKFAKAKRTLNDLKLERRGYEIALRILRLNMKSGTVPLNQFYAREQECLYRLDCLDEQVIAHQYEANKLRNRKKDYEHTRTRR